jgi:hypothetical protein
MFEDIQGWKASSALGGALGGISAMDQIQNSQQRRQMNNLDMLIKDLQLQESQKNGPLNDLNRQNAMSAAGDQQGAWQDGTMGQINAGKRQLEHETTQTQIDRNRINKTLASAEFYNMADQYLGSIEDKPHLIAGEGWNQIRDAGRSIGLNLPEQYTPDARAKIKAAAQVSMNTIPYLQKMQEQARMFEHQRNLQTDKQTHDAGMLGTKLEHDATEGALDRKSRETIARISAEAARTSAQGKVEPIDAVLNKVRQSDNMDELMSNLTVGDAMVLDGHLRKTMDPIAARSIDNQLEALRAASNNPKVREEARKKLKDSYASQYGALGTVVASKLAQGIRTPQEGQIRQPEAAPQQAPTQQPTPTKALRSKTINGTTYEEYEPGKWRTK